MIKSILFIFLLAISVKATGQNWSTFGGGSTRNGLSKITAPANVASTYWTVNASPTTLGNAVYTFGDKFVTSRITFSPYTGFIICGDLQTGLTQWTSPFISNTAIMYAIGFNEDGVYAHDYNTDTIYALSPVNGAILWRGKIKSQTFGAYPGCVFACNGDLIVNAPMSSGKFTMRLNKYNGDTLWTNNELIAIGPAVGLAATESTVYRVTGGITIPIKLTAIDINTGVTKYSSLPIPGDADQENPITIGPGGEIYFWRDGGNLHAYEDNGSGLFPIWSYVPQVTTGVAIYGNITVGKDSNLYVFDNGNLQRLDHTNGTVLDSCFINIPEGAVSVGNDNTVYVNDKNGSFYAFTQDLQTLIWQIAAPGNTYCNIAPAKDGILILTRSGVNIYSYKTAGNFPPVADFRVSSTLGFTGQPFNFFDQSSFLPTSWEWSFPGASISSSTSQNPTGIIYNTPGIYEVQLLASNVLGADSVLKKCYLEVQDATGNNFIGNVQEVVIYPNPASGFFNVDLKSSLNEKVKIQMMDMLGRICFETIYANSASVNRIALENNIVDGIYVIHILSDGLQHSEKLLIKNQK